MLLLNGIRSKFSFLASLFNKLLLSHMLMEQDTLDQTLNLHISWLFSAFLLSRFIGILVYWCPVNEKAEAAECRALWETQISKFNGEADPKSPQ